MGSLSGKRGSIVFVACLVALASAIGTSANVQADTETETVLPGMYLALFYEMDKGVTINFNVSSTVPIYVYFLDKTNYDSYSALGTIPSALFRTLAPVATAESSVEAPADGRYYLIMENPSTASQTASVTIEYSFGGTGLSLIGLLIVLAIGVIIGLVVLIIILKRRKTGQQPGQQYPPPPMPPPQP